MENLAGPFPEFERDKLSLKLSFSIKDIFYLVIISQASRDTSLQFDLWRRQRYDVEGGARRREGYSKEIPLRGSPVVPQRQHKTQQADTRALCILLPHRSSVFN